MKKLYSLNLIFLITLNSFTQTPDWAWAKSAGGGSTDEAKFVATDASGNIYVAGYFQSSTIIFDTTTLNNDTTIGTDIFLVKYDNTGNVIWAKSAGGSSSERINSVATDAFGNIYVTGYFQSSTITFGSTTLTNANNTFDVFLTKFDFNGNILWAKSAGGGSGDEAKSVATDASGNIYVAGYFQSSTITFDTTTLNNDTTNGTTDIFLVKYDSTGNVIWAKSAGGSSNELTNSVATDASGNVYMAGGFQSSTIILGSTTLTTSGNMDLFLAKYDLNGNVIWAKSAGGGYADEAYSVASDTSGNVYVVGWFISSTIIFDFTTLTNTTTNNYDMFLAKYDLNGNVLWAKSAGGNINDDAKSVATDASGNVFVSGGFFSPTITFDSTTLTNTSTDNDMFIVKYDLNGNVLWRKMEWEMVMMVHVPLLSMFSEIQL